MARPALEVADIFRDHGAAWRHANRGHVSLLQLKVMSAIESCRTAALGGHVARCEDCAHTTIAYNSCRNRHCPKCQGAAARQWMAAREAELLPIPYFHVVFTLPSAIGDIAYQNKAVIYDLLFKASSETMLTIAADPKHLGARIGITSVLHSWGSAMTHHPHLHMIVPGGGLSMDDSRWISCKPNFLLPVRVLSKLFRRLMLEKLLAAHASGQAAVPRLTRASGRCQGVRGVPRPAQQEALVRLRQAPVRGPEGRARLSVALHPPRRHLEPPPDRSRPAERHVQGQGLQDRRPRPLHDDDARRRRVHPPVPHPRAAQRLPSHPPLRLVRQRATAPRRSRGRANSWVWPRLRPKRRSRSIRRRRSHSPSLARAVAAACSSSRPSRPAANHAIGRPRLSSQSGSTPHERGRHIPHPHRQARFLAGHNPATATLGRTATRHRFPQRNLPRKPSSSRAQASPRPTSARHHLTATLSRLASTVNAAIKSP